MPTAHGGAKWWPAAVRQVEPAPDAVEVALLAVADVPRTPADNTFEDPAAREAVIGVLAPIALTDRAARRDSAAIRRAASCSGSWWFISAARAVRPSTAD